MTRWKRKNVLSKRRGGTCRHGCLETRTNSGGRSGGTTGRATHRNPGFKFAPDVQSAKTGDRITWVNNDIVPHTATALDKSWDTGTIPKGGSKTVTVTDACRWITFAAFIQ